MTHFELDTLRVCIKNQKIEMVILEIFSHILLKPNSSFMPTNNMLETLERHMLNACQKKKKVFGRMQNVFKPSEFLEEIGVSRTKRSLNIMLL